MSVKEWDVYIREVEAGRLDYADVIAQINGESSVKGE
jgi:hypothetical protein